MYAVTYPEIFWGDQFQQGLWGGECKIPPYVTRAKPWWAQAEKLPEAPRI